MNIPFDLPVWLQIFFVVGIGLSVGSFLNVIIYRLPRGKSIAAPSSRCGFCKSSIPCRFNIPVVGFFLVKGVCAKCGHPYSGRYAFVEVLTGVLALAVWSMFGWTLSALFLGIFVATLVAISFIDIDLRIIPDSLSLGGLSFGLLIALINPEIFGLNFLQAAGGAVTGFLIFWILSRAYYFFRQEEGLGGGDVKLMAFVGGVLGVSGVVTATLIGSLLGTLFGLVSLFLLGRTKHYPIPFGPFLAIGALVSAFKLDMWIYQ